MVGVHAVAVVTGAPAGPAGQLTTIWRDWVNTLWPPVTPPTVSPAGQDADWDCPKFEGVQLVGGGPPPPPGERGSGIVTLLL